MGDAPGEPAECFHLAPLRNLRLHLEPLSDITGHYREVRKLAAGVSNRGDIHFQIDIRPISPMQPDPPGPAPPRCACCLDLAA